MQLELRIASPKLDHDKLLQVLLEQRQPATVLRGTQLAPGGPDGDIYPAAFVYLFDCDKQRFTSQIWPALRGVFDLTCAYVSVYDNGFHGCVLNYAEPTRCPMARQPARTAQRPEVVAHTAGMSRWLPHEAMICRAGRCEVAVQFQGVHLAVSLADLACDAWTFGLAKPPPRRLLPAASAWAMWLLPYEEEEELDLEAVLHSSLQQFSCLPCRPAALEMPDCCKSMILHPDELPAGAEVWLERPHYIYSDQGEGDGAWFEAIGCGMVELCYQGGAFFFDDRGEVQAHWLRWNPTQKPLPALAVISGGEPKALLRRDPACIKEVALRRTAEAVTFEVNGEVVHAAPFSAPSEAVGRLVFEAEAGDVGKAVSFEARGLA